MERSVGLESVEVADENYWLSDSDEPTQIELRECVIDGTRVILPETEEELYKQVCKPWQQALRNLDQAHVKAWRSFESNANVLELVAKGNGYKYESWERIQMQGLLNAQKRTMERQFKEMLRDYWISIGDFRKSILIRHLEANTKYRLYPSCSFDFNGRIIVVPDDIRSAEDVKAYSESIYYELKAILQRSLSHEQSFLKHMQKENKLYLLVSEQEFFESVVWDCVRKREERIRRKKDKERELEDAKIGTVEEPVKIAQGLRAGKKILERRFDRDGPSELAEGKKSAAKIRRRIVDHREKREKTEAGEQRETGKNPDFIAASQGLHRKDSTRERRYDLESQAEIEVAKGREAKIPKSQGFGQPTKKSDRSKIGRDLSEAPQLSLNFEPIGKPRLCPERNYDDDDAGEGVGSFMFKKGGCPEDLEEADKYKSTRIFMGREY
jgi:hypothetical protein